MKYLGLDLGTKTLGISESDSLGVLATSREVVKHEDDLEYLKDKVLEIVKEDNIDEIVLGYPINMDGTVGERAKRSEEFKKILEKEGLIVHLEDERLSTKEAENNLIFTDTKRKKRKKVIDSFASSIILQRYLDRR